MLAFFAKQQWKNEMNICKCSRLFLPIAGAGILALLGGCATLTLSQPGMLDRMTVKGTEGRPSQMVVIETNGYYMFWSIPLASGDLRWNDETKTIEGGLVFFQDQVGLEELQTALTKYAESRDCDLVDVCFYDSDTSYAGPSYSGILGILFGSSRMAVSAILVPRQVANN